MAKKFRIKYEVHCKLQNFFNKEMIVKECLSELHAKTKLDDYCRKHYVEYSYIIIKSCVEEHILQDLLGDVFDTNKNTISDIFKNIKK